MENIEPLQGNGGVGDEGSVPPAEDWSRGGPVPQPTSDPTQDPEHSRNDLGVGLRQHPISSGSSITNVMFATVSLTSDMQACATADCKSRAAASPCDR